MKDECTYLIQLHGHVEETEINFLDPFQLTLDRYDQGATLLKVTTDQSGMVGLVRHLHGLGLVFLSVKRVEKDNLGE